MVNRISDGFLLQYRVGRANDKGFYGTCPTAERSWRNYKFVCALADSDRHLGRIIKTEQWHADDATHLNAAAQGFKYLGAFGDSTSGKRAVESSVAGVSGIRAIGAECQRRLKIPHF